MTPIYYQRPKLKNSVDKPKATDNSNWKKLTTLSRATMNRLLLLQKAREGFIIRPKRPHELFGAIPWFSSEKWTKLSNFREKSWKFLENCWKSAESKVPSRAFWSKAAPKSSWIYTTVPSIHHPFLLRNNGQWESSMEVREVRFRDDKKKNV